MSTSGFKYQTEPNNHSSRMLIELPTFPSNIFEDNMLVTRLSFWFMATYPIAVLKHWSLNVAVIKAPPLTLFRRGRAHSWAVSGGSFLPDSCLTSHTLPEPKLSCSHASDSFAHHRQTLNICWSVFVYKAASVWKLPYHRSVCMGKKSAISVSDWNLWHQRDDLCNSSRLFFQFFPFKYELR